MRNPKAYLVLSVLLLSVTGNVMFDNVGLVSAICPRSDLDGDCLVDFRDFALMAEEWLSYGERPVVPFVGTAENLALVDELRNYFNGKLLTVRDFETEQAYHECPNAPIAFVFGTPWDGQGIGTLVQTTLCERLSLCGDTALRSQFGTPVEPLPGTSLLTVRQVGSQTVFVFVASGPNEIAALQKSFTEHIAEHGLVSETHEEVEIATIGSPVIPPGPGDIGPLWNPGNHGSISALAAAQLGGKIQNYTRRDSGVEYIIKWWKKEWRWWPPGFVDVVYHTDTVDGGDSPITILDDHSGSPDDIDAPDYFARYAGHACFYWPSACSWPSDAHNKAQNYYNKARDYFQNTTKDGAGFYYAALASHYVEDASNPMHTGLLSLLDLIAQWALAWHANYENYVENNWDSKFEPQLNVGKEAVNDASDAVCKAANTSGPLYLSLRDAWILSNYAQVDAKTITALTRGVKVLAGLYDILPLPNRAPSTPSTPSGTTSGTTGISYNYSTSATDPDNDQVRYTFDWGDAQSTITGLVNSGQSASVSHSWGAAGTYSVKARATDSKGAQSGWSGSLTVNIALPPNRSPNTPSTPSGTVSGTAGVSYNYSTSATDPDGDQVRYTFDWGDTQSSTTGLVNSGQSASVSHSWSAAGAYSVKARATDSKGAQSGWSSVLTVQIAAVQQLPVQCGVQVLNHGQAVAFPTPFSTTPTVLTSAQVGSRAVSSAAVSVTATGFTVYLTNDQGSSVSNAWVQWIAVVPDLSKDVVSGIVQASNGDQITFPAMSATPVIVTNAQKGGKALISGAQNNTSGSFSLFLVDDQGYGVSNAWLLWLAVVPGSKNGFKGEIRQRNDGDNVSFSPSFAKQPTYILSAQPGAIASAINNRVDGFTLSLIWHDGLGANNVWTQWLGFAPP